MVEAPSIDAIRALRLALDADIVRTPLVRCAALEELLGHDTRVFGKLEFLQRTGTFKARGALATLRSLTDAQRAA
ncbi:MAG: pyridoxal-phosphate dependent enzyme, partial [Woeseiaceae bacterium]